MEHRPFGNTGLVVSVLGFGAAQVGDATVSEGDAGRLLNEVLDAGVTLIDTARGYGLSEERIGRHLAHRRSDFVLSSKCGYDIEGTANWTPECITAGIDRALRLLQTDHLDIMHLHSCGLDILEGHGVVDALAEAVEKGKVRVAAYSGENAARRWAIDSNEFGSIQTSVNVCDQLVLDADLPAAHAAGLGVIAKRPLANAFWRFATRPADHYCLPYWDRARAMNLNPPDDMSWDEFALRFAAHQPGVHSVIAGTAKMDHFRRNAELIARGPLPADLVEATRELFRRHRQPDWLGEV